jgi:hypothetical protein
MLLPAKARDDCRRGTSRFVRGITPALADFQSVLESAPTFPKADNNRGITRHVLGGGPRRLGACDDGRDCVVRQMS